MAHYPPKLLADHIVHLTDARYYAAAGVEKMVFEPLPEQTKEQAIMYISALVEWVEGTEIWLRPDGLLNDADAHSLNITGVVIPEQELKNWASSNLKVIVEVPFKSSNFPSANEILWCPGTETQYEEILNTIISTSSRIWLSIDPDSRDALAMLDLPAYGFVLQGSREQAVGLKDYSWEEKILEHFEEN